MYQPAREPLLQTKLFIPPTRSKRVTRPGLIEQINKNLDKTLILISAPAGFGKTTLLADWVAQADLRVAWLSLDAGDNDLYRFLNYVVAALNNTLAEQETAICVTTQAMLQSVQPLPTQTILITFINELTNISEPFALVLDDYQFITSPAVNEAMSDILEHLPSQIHLLIASRVDPSLPLHRLRASGRMLELRTDELRFSNDETNTFMNKVMGLSLSDEDISTLSKRSEGWIVGLQMAALSMQGIQDRSGFVKAFSGSHRYILEYLIEEVLDCQSEKIRDFLLQTSILDQLCGPLCNAVLADEYNSQIILEDLNQSNLFLIPLDQVGYWYRYHRLFADLLRARLQRSQQENIPTLHLRASQWYEETGLPEKAIQHALAAKELERAAQLVERHALEILSRGEMSSLLRFFEALPEDLVISRPTLGVYLAWAFTFSGQFDQTEAHLREIERQIELNETAPENKAILGSIAVIRSLIADMRGEMVSALELARLADELLPEEDWAERSVIPFVLGDGYAATGELAKAEQAFEEIKKMGQASGVPWTVSVALHKSALLKKLQGQLRLAESLYQEAIHYASERGGRHYGSIGATYVGLGDLLREKNDLEAAKQMVVEAVENMEQWRGPTDLINAYGTLARISLAQGEIGSAAKALEKAERISRQGGTFTITQKTLEASQVRLWLVKGDLPKVNRWIKERQFDETEHLTDPQLDFINELEWITMARVLVAKGEFEAALNLLDPLADAAELGGRYGRLIEILILTSLALHASGKSDQSLKVLIKSLALAEPEGYMRIFLDEGRPMEALLRACNTKSEGSLKGYTAKLLQAFAIQPDRQIDISTSTYQTESLVEHLTGREVEVLHLLAAGLSNQEIAEQLVISVGTVKTHTHNLYAKLGADSRTRAIARAKELNLI